MKRRTSHFQGSEPVLESLLRNLRYKMIIPHITLGSDVMDLGCGYDYAFLKTIEKKIKHGIGIDVSVPKIKDQKITLIKTRADKPINLNNKFDFITSLAVIEHVDYPEVHVRVAYKYLKKGGQFLLTTPSKKSKPVLEFLSFKLGIVSREEISDHKRYYSKTELEKLLKKAGFSIVEVIEFEFGLNLFARATK